MAGHWPLVPSLPTMCWQIRQLRPWLQLEWYRGINISGWPRRSGRRFPQHRRMAPCRRHPLLRPQRCTGLSVPAVSPPPPPRHPWHCRRRRQRLLRPTPCLHHPHHQRYAPASSPPPPKRTRSASPPPRSPSSGSKRHAPARCACNAFPTHLPRPTTTRALGRPRWSSTCSAWSRRWPLITRRPWRRPLVARGFHGRRRSIQSPW
ncbi:hypothetical protein BC828DRAFT_265754 [Blastocladiella britannica]|nr:hypothetical protein BC828DRAFT_265754 [Blastocladiella britannica]